MTKNYAFVWDNVKKEIVEKVCVNGMGILGELPWMCYTAMHNPERFKVTLAAGSGYLKSGPVNMAFWAMMYEMAQEED